MSANIETIANNFIKTGESVYYKHWGLEEFKIIRAIRLSPTEKITDLPATIITEINKKATIYLALKSVNSTETELVDLDVFESVWYPAHLKLKEGAEANKDGFPLVKKFFSRYGVLHQKYSYSGNEDNSFGSAIYYDGKSTPKEIWNSTLLEANLIYYLNKRVNNRGTAGVVWSGKLEFNQTEEDLVDAESSTSIRFCHSKIRLQDNDIYTHHYTRQEWLEDIKKAKNLYMKSLSKLFNEGETIAHNNKGYYFQPSKDYIVYLHGNHFNKCEFLNREKTKFRNFSCKISKTPKLLEVTNKEELIKETELIVDSYLVKAKEIPFKYMAQ